MSICLHYQKSQQRLKEPESEVVYQPHLTSTSHGVILPCFLIQCVVSSAVEAYYQFLGGHQKEWQEPVSLWGALRLSGPITPKDLVFGFCLIICGYRKQCSKVMQASFFKIFLKSINCVFKFGYEIVGFCIFFLIVLSFRLTISYSLLSQVFS